MSDPTPAVVDAEPASAPAPAPAPASATVLPALIEAYPACFDWEHPRPLKIGLHRDLLAAGLGEARVKGADLQRALARYCHRPLYRWTLRAGATRVDLHGQPAGVVTAAEVKTARAAWKARQTGRPVPPRPGDAPSSPKEAHPPNATPLPKEHLVPGRLELTVKFSELPRPRSGPGWLQNGHPNRGGDRHHDPAGQGLAQAGTGGPGLSTVGGRAERGAGALRRRGDRAQASGRPGVREEGQARRRAGGEGVGSRTGRK